MFCECIGSSAKCQLRLAVSVVAREMAFLFGRIASDGDRSFRVALHLDAARVAYNRLRRRPGGDAVRAKTGRLKQLVRRSAAAVAALQRCAHSLDDGFVEPLFPLCGKIGVQRFWLGGGVKPIVVCWPVAAVGSKKRSMPTIGRPSVLFCCLGLYASTADARLEFMFGRLNRLGYTPARSCRYRPLSGRTPAPQSHYTCLAFSWALQGHVCLCSVLVGWASSPWPAMASFAMLAADRRFVVGCLWTEPRPCVALATAPMHKMACSLSQVWLHSGCCGIPMLCSVVWERHAVEWLARAAAVG